jgi:hypothetical protein
MQQGPLQVLCLVPTAALPLHIACGPSRDVWTTCAATEDWFQRQLLATEDFEVLGGVSDGQDAAIEAPWWTRGVMQSPLGILAQVNCAPVDGAPRVTQVLFYSTVSGLDGIAETAELRQADASRLVFRIHALPLSSDLLCLPVNEWSDGHCGSIDVERHSLQAPASAKAHSTLSMENAIPKPTEQGQKKRRSRGQTVSIDASNGVANSASTGPNRPVSASKIAAGNGVTRDLNSDGSVSKETNGDGNWTGKNKETISRVVMAGLRLYGVQPRKRNKVSLNEPLLLDTGEIGVNFAQDAGSDHRMDEEYKSLYHLVYKGTVFAFRSHISTEPLHLHQASLRDTVDRLLGTYCSDPLNPSTITAF